jgi:hypothetical protein
MSELNKQIERLSLERDMALVRIEELERERDELLDRLKETKRERDEERVGREKAEEKSPEITAGDWVRLLEPKAPGGCDVSNLAVGGIHRIERIEGNTIYFETHSRVWCWRRDSVEAAACDEKEDKG